MMMRPFSILVHEAAQAAAENLRRSAEYKGGPKRFTFLGNEREADMPWLSDEEMAGAVRMLMRDQIDHESICCAGRDRILHLSQENLRLRDALSLALQFVPLQSEDATDQSAITKIADLVAGRAT